MDKPSLPLPMKEANGVDLRMERGDKALLGEHIKNSCEKTRKAMEERLELRTKQKVRHVLIERKNASGNAVKLHQKENGKAPGEVSELHLNRKGKGLLFASDDVHENAVQENHHPDYELLLKYLKEYKIKSCEGKSKNDSSYVDTKHKEDSDDVCENDVQENHHPDYEVLLKYMKEYKIESSEGKIKNDSSYVDTRRKEDSDDVCENVVQENHHPDYEVLLEYLKEHKIKSSEGKIKNDSSYVDTKRKEDSDDVCKNVVQENHHPDYEVLLENLKEYKIKSSEGKIKNDSSYVDTKHKEDIGSGKKSTRFIFTCQPCLAKKKRDDDEKGRLKKCVSTEFKNASMKRKSMSCESSDDIVEVTPEEDGTAVKKSSPCHKEAFGPSVKFRDVGGNSCVMPTDTKAEFRRRILEIISKPFDKAEYIIIKEEFNARTYTDYHPDLEKVLMENRNSPRKRLALMRGFYFWVQNLGQEGTFKPWTDNICLAVSLSF